MARIIFNIPNMHCPACNMHLEALEDELDGIEYIKGNYKKQTLDVVFDETLLSEAELRAAIIDLDYDIAG